MTTYEISWDEISNSTKLQQGILSAFTIASSSTLVNMTVVGSNGTDIKVITLTDLENGQFMQSPVIYSIEWRDPCPDIGTAVTSCVIVEGSRFSAINMIVKFQSYNNRILWESNYDAISTLFESKLESMWYGVNVSQLPFGVYADFNILDSSPNNGFILPTRYPTTIAPSSLPTLTPSLSIKTTQEKDVNTNNNDGDQSMIRFLQQVIIGLCIVLVCVVVASVCAILKQCKAKKQLSEKIDLLSLEQTQSKSKESNTGKHVNVVSGSHNAYEFKQDNGKEKVDIAGNDSDHSISELYSGSNVQESKGAAKLRSVGSMSTGDRDHRSNGETNSDNAELAASHIVMTDVGTKIAGNTNGEGC